MTTDSSSVPVMKIPTFFTSLPTADLPRRYQRSYVLESRCYQGRRRSSVENTALWSLSTSWFESLQHKAGNAFWCWNLWPLSSLESFGYRMAVEQRKFCFRCKLAICTRLIILDKNTWWLSHHYLDSKYFLFLSKYCFISENYLLHVRKSQKIREK